MDILLDLLNSVKSLLATANMAVDVLGLYGLIGGFLFFLLIMAAFGGVATLIKSATKHVAVKAISHMKKARS